MSDLVLVTMQVTTHQSVLAAEPVAERLAAIIRDCFEADGESASISVQPYDPDAPVEDDCCATCGAVIGDPEQHVAWHAAQIRALAAPQPDADEPNLRTFGEEPCHA